MASIKGPAPEQHDGSGLRIAIVHARWNHSIIGPLVDAAKARLLASGVAQANIVVQSVPGSWELPLAVQRMFAASQVQASTSAGPSLSAGDLLGSSSTASLDASATSGRPASVSPVGLTSPFDAIIAVGVLIKGETMHFEYIADAVSHGLMRVQLDTGVPVVFGVLTALTEEQASARAGLVPGSHNHGDDWGLTAVELGSKRRAWANGRLS